MTGAPARRSLCRRRHAWLIFQPRVVRPGWGLRIHSGSCDAIARLWRTDATSAASLGARAVEAVQPAAGRAHPHASPRVLQERSHGGVAQALGVVGIVREVLERVARPLLRWDRVVDTLALARRRHPGAPASLDALCRRYAIDNSHRELHGALLDARLLVDVYLAMTGGQVALILGTEETGAFSAAEAVVRAVRPAIQLIVVRATDEETQAHERYLGLLDTASGGQCLWKRAVAG